VFTTIALALLLTCQAAAPLKIASVAAVSDLVAEAEIQMKELETQLASEASYRENKKAITASAGILAVMAQGIGESEEKPAWKASNADLRDGALSVARAKNFQEAQAGLAAIKAAYGGKAAGAKSDAEWNRLAGLRSLMVEINSRNNKLKVAARKIPADPKDLSDAVRHASVSAVLTLAVHDDTHEVKDKAAIPDWQRLAKDYSGNMTAASAALRKNDQQAVKAAYDKSRTACADCHEKYRPD
jgi:cytochrome c556